MADSPEFDIQAATAFGVWKKLKGNKTLRLELAKQIRLEAVPVVAELKAAVMSIDSKVEGQLAGGAIDRAKAAGSGKSQAKKDHGLRATIARSIGVVVRLTANQPGVRIRVDVSKLPADQKNLPQALNKAKFRHPVYGEDVWVDQTGKAGWWDRTIDKHRDGFRSACLRAMKATVDKL